MTRFWSIVRRATPWLLVLLVSIAIGVAWKLIRDPLCILRSTAGVNINNASNDPDDPSLSLYISGANGLRMASWHSRFLGEIDTLKISGTDLPIAAIIAICRSKNIRSVSVFGPSVDNSLILVLSGKEDLQSFDGSGSQITDISLLLTECNELSSLILSGCALSNSSMTRQRRETLLIHTLYLPGCDEPIKGLKAVIEDSPKIRRISVSGDRNVESLIAVVQPLDYLAISDCHITGDLARTLTASVTSRELYIDKLSAYGRFHSVPPVEPFPGL